MAAARRFAATGRRPLPRRAAWRSSRRLRRRPARGSDRPPAGVLRRLGCRGVRLRRVSSGIEMRGRSRGIHSGLADAMIHNAVEQFLPAGAAGVLLALVFCALRARDCFGCCPASGRFSSASACSHPCARCRVASRCRRAWYFVAGFGVLMLASGDHALSPWTHGPALRRRPVADWPRSSISLRDRAMPKTDPAPFSYEGLDRVIHEKARLGVLTSLMAHPEGPRLRRPAQALRPDRRQSQPPPAGAAGGRPGGDHQGL